MKILMVFCKDCGNPVMIFDKMISYFPKWSKIPMVCGRCSRKVTKNYDSNGETLALHLHSSFELLEGSLE